MTEKGPENLTPDKTTSESEEGPLEVLKRGREGMEKSSYIKILREELQELKKHYQGLLLNFKMADSPLQEESVLKLMEKNKEEQSKIQREMQAVEDRIKKQMIDSAKKKKD